MTAVLEVGEWGVFTGNGGRQLVLAGGTPCGPVSARKATASIPRRLLLDQRRVSAVMCTGTAVQEMVTMQEANWDVHLRPLLSPTGECVVGVIGGVITAGEAMPQPPLVGTWQWQVERDDEGEPTAHRRTYWDPALFDLYGVGADAAQRAAGHWEAGEWLNELVDQADQMRVSTNAKEFIRDGIAGLADEVRGLTYRIVTGYGIGEPGSRHLRMVGRASNTCSKDSTVLIQGFSYEVPDSFRDLAFVQDGARVDDVLRGVIELTNEPLAVVDGSTFDVLMTSPAWRRAGLGHIGGLDELSSADSAVMQEFVGDVIESRGKKMTTTMELTCTDGSVRSVQVVATAVSSSEGGEDVALRVDV